MSEPLVIELQFGGVPVTVAVGLDDIFGLAPADRDALFAFVDYVKTAATTPRIAPPPRPPSVPNPSKGIKATTECDQCGRTFKSLVAIGVHKARAHAVRSPNWKPSPADDGPKPTPATEAAATGVLELTCETCSAPLTSIEKLKAHTVARHGRDPRPTELVANKGPR